jgi:hypothetical protein
MVFNTTFKNISAMLWQSNLLMQETAKNQNSYLVIIQCSTIFNRYTFYIFYFEKSNQRKNSYCRHYPFKSIHYIYLTGFTGWLENWRIYNKYNIMWLWNYVLLAGALYNIVNNICTSPILLEIMMMMHNSVIKIKVL